MSRGTRITGSAQKVEVKKLQPIYLEPGQKRHFVDYALAVFTGKPRESGKWNPLCLVNSDAHEVLYRVRVYLPPGWWEQPGIWGRIQRRCERRLAQAQADEIF